MVFSKPSPNSLAVILVVLMLTTPDLMATVLLAPVPNLISLLQFLEVTFPNPIIMFIFVTQVRLLVLQPSLNCIICIIVILMIIEVLRGPV